MPLILMLVFSSNFIFDQILSTYQNFDEFEFEFNLDNLSSYHLDTGLSYFNDLDFNYLESNESAMTIEANNNKK